MEEEVRDILRNAVNEQDAAVGGLGSEIASLFAPMHSARLIGAKRNPGEFLLRPNCTQISSILPLACTFDSASQPRRSSLTIGKTKPFPKDQAVAGNQNL